MYNFKTKAINNYNNSVTMQSGRVGTVRYVQKGGLTYTRSATVSKMTNPRSKQQMRQRLKFASLERLGRSMDLQKCFVKTNPNQSYINLFMKANQGEGVFFTKAENAAKYQIAMPVIFSDGSGSMPEIETKRMTWDGSWYAVSNIVLGQSFSFGNATTVAQLTEAILAKNDGIEEGDMLTFVSLLQSAGMDGRPKVSENRYYLVLKRDDLSLVSEHITPDALNNVNGYLATTANPPAGCYGYTLSRHTKNDGFDVSKAKLANFNLVKYGEYSSEEKFDEARASYEPAADAMIDPNSHDEDEESEMVQVSLSGSHCDVYGAGYYAKGSTVAISCIPNDDYRFVSWSDGVTLSERNIIVEENITLTANVESAYCQLTIEVDTEGAGTVAPASGRYPKGEAITVSCIPHSGYTFSRWEDEAMTPVSREMVFQYTPTEDSATLTACLDEQE